MDKFIERIFRTICQLFIQGEYARCGKTGNLFQSVCCREIPQTDTGKKVFCQYLERYEPNLKTPEHRVTFQYKQEINNNSKSDKT